MCSTPVTLGGGMTSENVRPVFFELARKIPGSIHHWAQAAQTVEARRLFRFG